MRHTLEDTITDIAAALMYKAAQSPQPNTFETASKSPMNQYRGAAKVTAAKVIDRRKAHEASKQRRLGGALIAGTPMAAVGALSGAIGGRMGGKTLKGALIGTGIGALTGGTLGGLLGHKAHQRAQQRVEAGRKKLEMNAIPVEWLKANRSKFKDWEDDQGKLNVRLYTRETPGMAILRKKKTT